MDLLVSFLAVVISLAIWPGSDPFELPKLLAASTLLVAMTFCYLNRSVKKNGLQPSVETGASSHKAASTLITPSLVLLLTFILSILVNGTTRRTFLGSEASADGIVALLIGLSTIFLVAYANKKRSILLAWLVGCAIAALYGITQRLGLDPIPWQGENLAALNYRVFGTLGNPSFLAMLLSMAIPIGLILTSELQARKRTLAIVATLITAVTLPLTMSRIGIIAGIVGISVVWLWSKADRKVA